MKPIIERVTLDVQGGENSYGIVIRAQANATVRDSTISVSNTSNGYGLYILDGVVPDEEFARVEIEVSGSTSATGIYGSPMGHPGVMKLSDFTITATGAIANYGVRLSGAAAILRSSLTGSGGASSFGVFSDTLNPVTVDHSVVTGATATAFGGDVRIGATRLIGGPMAGFGVCAGVYDEDYTFFASTCP